MSQQRRYIIDRFEDNGWAVLEVDAGVTFDVPSDWLPEGAKEGDALLLNVEKGTEHAEIHFTIEQSETEDRQQHIRSKLDQLRKRGK